jgi:hypothetical protein
MNRFCFTAFNVTWQESSSSKIARCNINYSGDFEKTKKEIAADLQKAPDLARAEVEGFSYTDKDGTKVDINTAEQYKIFRDIYLQGKHTNRTDFSTYLKVSKK